MGNIFHCGFCFSKLASKKCYKMKHISFLKKLLTLYIKINLDGQETCKCKIF